MVTSELEKVHLSNGGRSRTAAACSGVEFRNGSQLVSCPDKMVVVWKFFPLPPPGRLKAENACMDCRGLG